MMINLKREKGSTIIMLTMVILTAILTVVLTSSEIVKNNLAADRLQLNSTKAYYSAESAAERILWQVRYKTDISCTSENDCIEFTGAETTDCDATNCVFANTISPALTDYKFYIKYNISGSDKKLTCYGNYKEARRAVQIIY